MSEQKIFAPTALELGCQQEHIDAILAACFAVDTAEGNAWIGGRALRLMIEGKPSEEFDVFFRNQKAVQSLEEALEDQMDYKMLIDTKNFRTVSLDNGSMVLRLWKKRYYRDHVEVLTSFNLTRDAIVTDGGLFLDHPEAIDDIKKKLISYVKIDELGPAIQAGDDAFAEGWHRPSWSINQIIEFANKTGFKHRLLDNEEKTQ